MSKRLFLYFFLYSIATTFTGQLYAATPFSNVQKQRVYSTQLTPKSQLTPTQNCFEFLKGELVYDNDNEENEFEQELSKKQDLSINLPKKARVYFNWGSTTSFKQTVSCNYYRENTSRLPRFNFIALRVLRL